MFRRKKREPEKGAPKWMVTYSDMVTLILVFFILLFSMSVIDAEKFKAIAESFQQRQVFDFMPSPIEFQSLNNERQQEDPVARDERKDSMENLYGEVKEFLDANELAEMISVTREERGVVLVLQEQTLFRTAEAEIVESAEPFLDKVGALLKSIPNVVRVEGHTDSRPISTYRYPSNWELSGARASSVIRYLIEKHDIAPNRFIVAGYGDTRPVVPNTSVENLQLNRRVVIVISDPDVKEEETY